jgi:hypothetical protein
MRNPKSQTNSKPNVPSFKTNGTSRLRFVVCNLMLVWDFGFGAWDFNEFSVSSVAKNLCG